jgi:hypothetical protein
MAYILAIPKVVLSQKIVTAKATTAAFTWATAITILCAGVGVIVRKSPFESVMDSAEGLKTVLG